MSARVRVFGRCMGGILIVCVSIFLLTVLVRWSDAQSGEPQTPMSGEIYNVLSETRYEVVEHRDYHQRQWQVVKEVEITDTVTNETTIEYQTSKIMEVGSGICYPDEQSICSSLIPAG